jgi:hypothetical protein
MRWPTFVFDFVPLARGSKLDRVHRMYGQSLIHWLSLINPNELPEGPKR